MELYVTILPDAFILQAIQSIKSGRQPERADDQKGFQTVLLELNQQLNDCC